MSSNGKLPPIRRRILSQSERERLEVQRDQNEREASGRLDKGDDLSPKARKAYEEQGDPKILAARNARIDRALKAGSIGPLTGVDRSRAEARVKELTGLLQKNMVPKTATELRPGSVAFNRAKNMMVRNELGSSVFQEMASEFKNLQRALHPDDPDAANLENIRPDTA